MLRRQRIEDVGGQPARFRAEQQVVAGLIADGAVRRRAFGGQGKQPLWVFGGEKGGVIGMATDAGELMVVQPGAAQALVVPRESQRFDQVQVKAGIGTQADDIAGVGWNFGFK